MPSTQQNLNVWKGEQPKLDWSVQDSSIDATTATDIELVVWSIGGTLLTKDFSDFSAPDANSVTVTLQPADTNSLTPGEYDYNLWMENSGGQPSVVATGKFIIHDARRV